MSSYVGGRMVAVVDLYLYLYLYLYGKTNNVGGSMVASVDRTPNWFSQIHKFHHTPATALLLNIKMQNDQKITEK